MVSFAFGFHTQRSEVDMACGKSENGASGKLYLQRFTPQVREWERRNGGTMLCTRITVVVR
jgi:hypothetical protein